MIHERTDELQPMHGQVHVPVPLPLEIPPPPNLAHLPAHILHSGTVETLIGQNEDLMARLKVNIRRNSILEQQLMEHDRVNQEITRAHNSLVSQLQVLKEKGEIWKEKSQTVDAQAESLNEQIELMQARVDATQERNDELHAGLKFEQAYRRRIRAWVRPYINALREKVLQEKTRANFLDRELEKREATIGDLRERMTAAVSQMQNLQKNTNQDQALLVEKYEAAVRKSEAAANEARANAENRIIYLERKNKEMEQALAGEMTDIQEQLVGFRKEAKKLSCDVMTSNEERDAMKAERDEAKAEQLRLQDQFESLQTVWAEAQKKFEASRLQQESLNKLNQELSRQLRADRKSRDVASTSTITTSGAATPQGASEQVKPAPQSLERIDSLLAALEAGFTKARGQDSQMNGLDFTESAEQKKSDTKRPNEASL